MTYQEAERLVITLHMNFANFLPKEVELAAAKRGLWVKELEKYEFKRGLEAVQHIVQTLQFPPTMYDLKTSLGVGGEYTRDDMLARLPGPTWDTPEGMAAQYAFDHDRARRIMDELDEELRTGRFTKTREEAIEANEVRLCPSF